jgi:hypothetical protein
MTPDEKLNGFAKRPFLTAGGLVDKSVDEIVQRRSGKSG